MFRVSVLGLEPLLDRDQHRVDAELEDREDSSAGLGLELLEPIQVPRTDDEGLLTKGICAVAQCQAHMSVVEVVGRADADPMHAIAFWAATELVKVTIETFNLLEEAYIEAVCVKGSDGVTRIGGGDESVPCVANRLEVAGSYVATDTDDSEISHHGWIPLRPALQPRPGDRTTDNGEPIDHQFGTTFEQLVVDSRVENLPGVGSQSGVNHLEPIDEDDTDGARDFLCERAACCGPRFGCVRVLLDDRKGMRQRTHPTTFAAVARATVALPTAPARFYVEGSSPESAAGVGFATWRFPRNHPYVDSMPSRN